MKIYAKIKIKGTKPLLICTFPIDSLSPSKSKSGSTGRNRSEWKTTVLMTADRNMYVMGCYIVNSIKNGGKTIKVGRGSISKRVQSCLECMDDRILIDGRFVPEEKDLTEDTTQPVYLDVRSVVNPMTKGRNVRYRIAASAGWTLSTVISWDDTVASREQIRQCLENAGNFEGIGDGRAIGFGRYSVVSYEKVDL